MAIKRNKNKSDDSVEKKDVKSAMARAGSLEDRVIADQISSRKRAWRVTGFMGAMLFISIGVTGLTIYRYSQPIPAQMLKVDRQTGFAEPIRLTGTEKSYGEEIDKGNIAQYVRARESYNYYQQQLNYDITRLMSSRNVFNPYADQYTGEDRITKQWGDSVVIRVSISSIILHGNTAEVRYVTQKQKQDSSTPEPEQRHIAKISFKYPKNRVMSGSERYKNPLGFLVTSWDSQIESH